jgi:Undecaprenyl-phosphate glucose phosphotransferase
LLQEELVSPEVRQQRWRRSSHQGKRKSMDADWITDSDSMREAMAECAGGVSVARQVALEDFRQPPCSLSVPNAWRSSAFAQLAFSLTAAACDALVIMTAALISELFYESFVHEYGSANSMVLVGSMVAALFVLPNATRREYRIDNYLKLNGQVVRTASLWSVVSLSILAIGFAAKVTAEFSRGATIVFTVLGFFALVGWRLSAVLLARKFVRPGSALSRRIYIVGYENEIAIFRGRYEAAMVGMDIVGVFALRGHGRMLPDLALAVADARALRPDEVFIILSWSHKKAIDACVDAFRQLPAAIHLGPEPLLSRFADAHISEVGCVPSLDLVRRPLSDGEVIMKRSLDIFGASLGLLVLAPLFATVAILIKLDSAGPVIFSQRRYGFNQEAFRILKFRSMTTMDDGPSIIQASRNDARITRVGRWIRCFNIDELPQLVNVLKGEMSLVGPRPHASAHDDKFVQTVEFYARRHNIKPGITGWAQVNGFRGEIKSHEDILHRVEHDLFYVDNWSIWLDFRCIWRTLVSAKAYRNAC